MKYKVEDELLIEITAVNYLKSQLEVYKKMKADVLRGLTPQPIESVDYSKWRVDGGVVKVIEDEINKLIEAQQNIIALEKLIQIKSDLLDKKSNCIKEVLTEREKIIYDRTFIKGETCEDVAFDMEIADRTVQRDRASIIAKIHKIQDKIQQII